MKLTTEHLRPLIAQAAVKDAELIKWQFVPGGDEDWGALGKPSCWRRLSKHRREDGKVERVFDHNQFDDQLRAYIISDSLDETIEKIEFMGE